MAHLQNDTAEHQRLKGVFKACAKVDLEAFYDDIAT